MNIRLAGAAAVTAALVLTGCTSGDDDTDATTETEATTEAMDEATDEATDEEMAESTDDAGAAGEEAGTIVDVAAGNEDFSTLVAAVEAADLVETLSGEGPFTVFAPTNDAFDALPEGVLDALLLEENVDVLTSILTYHVVSGEVTSDQVTDGDVATVEGQSVTLSTENGVMVNDATVVIADVEASNGVIHAIDAVLIPPDVDPASLVE
jgi:uncharacterized surface protein with fasciclin (FAS1) repeats